MNVQGSSAAMVVCTVSPASVSRKNLNGSTAPMVACTVSRASGAREDKGSSAAMVVCLCFEEELQLFFCSCGCLLCLVLVLQGKINLILIILLPWLLALHVVTAVSKKQKPSNNYPFSISRFVPFNVFDFGSSCFLQELTSWKYDGDS
jgi:hypothetical protein